MISLVLNEFFYPIIPGLLQKWLAHGVFSSSCPGEDESDRDFDGFGPPAGPMLSHRIGPVGSTKETPTGGATKNSYLALSENVGLIFPMK